MQRRDSCGLVNPFWNKQDGSCTPGSVTTFLFKLDWSVWSVNPFWNKMVPAQVGGNYKFTWKTFLVFGSVAFHRFCGNRWVWMNLDIGNTTSIFCERTPFYWTSFLHVLSQLCRGGNTGWVNWKYTCLAPYTQDTVLKFGTDPILISWMVYAMQGVWGSLDP